MYDPDAKQLIVSKKIIDNYIDEHKEKCEYKSYSQIVSDILNEFPLNEIIENKKHETILHEIEYTGKHIRKNAVKSVTVKKNKWEDIKGRILHDPQKINRKKHTNIALINYIVRHVTGGLTSQHEDYST